METGSIKKHFGVVGVSPLQFIVFLFIGALHTFWAILNKQLIQNASISQDIALQRDDILDKLFFLGFDPTVQRIISGTKWFLAGALLYMIVWVAIVVIVNTFDDIVIAESFMHPSSFSKSKFWTAVVARTLARIASATFIFVLCVVFLQVLPKLYTTVSDPSMLYKGVFLFMTAHLLFLYLSTIFLRFIFLRRRVF